jgi:uncharacterized protein involved in outer membrane biogenesis
MRRGTRLAGWLLSLCPLSAAAQAQPQLLPAWLGALEVEIEASAASLEWHESRARDIVLKARLVDGSLALEATTPDAAGGTLHARVVHEPPGESRMELSARGVDAGAIAALSPYVSAMPIDVDLRVRGSGTDLAALTTSAAGYLYVTHEGGGIIEKTVERAGGSLLGNMLGRLFTVLSPFRDTTRTTVVECLRVHAPIAAGRIEDPLLTELWTQRMRILGGGTVDLHTGTLDLALTPTARQGIRISGLDAVHAIEVTGSVADPQVHLDSGRLFQRAAALGTVVATAGGRAVIDTINARRAGRRVPCGGIAPP